MSTLVLLRFGVDTLEAQVAGDLPQSIRGDLEKGKDDAISEDAPVPYTLDGLEFFIQPKGLRYHPYLLENELISLRVTPSAKMPMVSLRLSAFGLALMGHEKLYERALRCSAVLGATQEVNISRIDLARDHQGFEPTREIMDNVRSRMRRVSHIKEGEGETFMYGHGPLVHRTYNKTAQANTPKLQWWHEIHAACEGYLPGVNVWRSEMQYRRPVLKDLGVHSVRDAFERLEELYTWGMTEVELRVPQNDSKITRWPVDPRWEAIRRVDGQTVTLVRPTKTPAMLSRYEAMKRVVSAASTFAAYEGVTDFFTLAPRLVTEILDYLVEEDIDFAGLVETKRRRLGHRYFGEEPF